MRRFGLFLLGCVLLFLFVPTAVSVGYAQEEETTDPQLNNEIDFAAQVEALLADMTPAERVGQLFLVSFPGATLTAESPILSLVQEYHVGGVLLRSTNGNLAVSSDAPFTTLTAALQTTALLGTLPPTTPTASLTQTLTAVPPTPITIQTPDQEQETGIPLFIALTANGRGQEPTQLGLSEIPSNMAIGATWQPALAQAVGQAFGRDLTAVGINMLLGPALDVQIQPQPLPPNNGLGTSVFGGHPYWVSQMGQAYIAGLNSGSDGRLAVIATHFPGLGSADRAGQVEIATVRKELLQLRQTDLVPFTAVVNNNGSPAHGFQTAHVRYQGLQGTISPSTPPFSLDRRAQEQLLQLPQLADWRTAGGVLVSDNLGVTAIRRFYNDPDNDFLHRQVAKDALLAGNDLLNTADFVFNDAALFNEAQYIANIQDTLSWFVTQYESDEAFRQRVDDAVRRNLALKLSLYDGNWSPVNVLPTAEIVAELPAISLFEVAQNGATLLSPAAADLQQRLPGPPAPTDNILVFTDGRTTRPCPVCPAAPRLSATALADRMLALYGPQASGQINPAQVQSFWFADLDQFLRIPGPILPTPTPEPITDTLPLEPEAGVPLPPPGPPEPLDTAVSSTPYDVQEALNQADWIIFNMLDVVPGTESAVVKSFLADRPDLARDKRIVLFAFDAPYYLDTTEVSQLTAYYGLYSSSQSFLNTAVRLLFQDFSPRGNAPVDVEGTDYRLARQVQPDPSQVLELFVVAPGGTPQTPPGSEPLELTPGDTLRLQTSVIRDRNGRQVPDGTLVQFTLQDRIQGYYSVIGQLPTHEGRATFDYVLEARTGQFRITVSAGEAQASQEVDIAIGDNVSVVVNTPTPTPTATPTSTPTPMPTVTPTSTLTPVASPTAVAEEYLNGSGDNTAVLSGLERFFGLITGLFIISLVAVVITQENENDLTRRIQCGLWGVIGALVSYNYAILGLPGTAFMLSLGAWGGLITAVVGGLLGIAAQRTISAD